MTSRRSLALLSTLALLVAWGPTAAPAQAAAEDAALQKVLKTLVNSIRYGKDDTAAKQVAFGPMAGALLGDKWKDASEAERKELTAGIETLIRNLSFPRGREMFEHLDAILYDPAKIEGDTAKVKSTVVVHRNYKKTEIGIEWVLVKDGGAWKVVDTVMLGESTTTGIREEQVEPLLKEGGIPAVLTAMRDKIAETKKK